jgi:hypothetical protein
LKIVNPSNPGSERVNQDCTVQEYHAIVPMQDSLIEIFDCMPKLLITVNHEIFKSEVPVS